MELYFLRHAIAADRGAQYKEDAQRPLTAEGKEKMSAVAQGMRALELSFDTILCSPYLRARQTAEIVIDVFKLNKSKLHYTDNLVPEAAPKKLLQEIHESFSKSNKLLFVGHEPHLSGLIAFLLTNGSLFPINLKKSSLCCLTWEPKDAGATLEWLLTPSQLRAIK